VPSHRRLCEWPSCCRMSRCMSPSYPCFLCIKCSLLLSPQIFPVLFGFSYIIFSLMYALYPATTHARSRSSCFADTFAGLVQRLIIQFLIGRVEHLSSIPFWDWFSFASGSALASWFIASIIFSQFWHRLRHSTW